MELEEGDKNLRETTKMASDNEQKLDEITRKLGVQEDESKRATERAELAEGKLKDVETELETIGENMKQLEISAEKATGTSSPVTSQHVKGHLLLCLSYSNWVQVDMAVA